MGTNAFCPPTKLPMTSILSVLQFALEPQFQTG